MSRKRDCPKCAYKNDQHEPDCPDRGRMERSTRLTPWGQREAFIQALDRIRAKQNIGSVVNSHHTLYSPACDKRVKGDSE